MSEQGYQGRMSGGVCGSPKQQGLEGWLHRSTGSSKNQNLVKHEVVRET
jgi:hypothetical protein